MSEESPELHLAKAELLDSINALRGLEGRVPLVELPDPPFCVLCLGKPPQVGALTQVNSFVVCARCATEARSL